MTAAAEEQARPPTIEQAPEDTSPAARSDYVPPWVRDPGWRPGKAREEDETRKGGGK